jgi:alkylhydroperoxidase family enzyme
VVRLILLRFVAAGEASFGERMDYLRHMLRASIGAFLKFVKLTSVSRYRRALPVGPFHVVRILAARHEDCGACVQTTVNMAKADGRPVAELRAVVEGRPDALSEDLADVRRFVDKVLCSTHDEGELRERIRARYRPHGDAALSEV